MGGKLARLERQRAGAVLLVRALFYHRNPTREMKWKRACVAKSGYWQKMTWL